MKSYRKQSFCGIDIGTSKIRVLIGKYVQESIKVMGFYEKDSSGTVVKGEISDMDKLLEILEETVSVTEKKADIPVSECRTYLAVSGRHLGFGNAVGSVVVKDGNGIVKNHHIDEAVRNAGILSVPDGSCAVDVLVSSFALDSNCVVQNPKGRRARELLANVSLVYGDKNIVQDYRDLLKNIGWELECRPVFSGIASMLAVLGDEEMRDGSLLVDLGGGTTEYIAVHNSMISMCGAFSVGCEHLANDLHIGLDLHINTTRKMLLDLDSFLDETSSVKSIRVPGMIARSDRIIPFHSYELVVDARLRELFGLIHSELKDKGMLSHISSGIVLSGGGAMLQRVSGVARDVFDIPVRIGEPGNPNIELPPAMRVPFMNTVAGLLIYGIMEDGDEVKMSVEDIVDFVSKTGKAWVKGMWQSIKF